MGAICDLCNGHYNKISEKKIGDMTYIILKCAKCGHTVAKQG